ncbi:MAG: hypothetical protein EZS28_021925 [Streblomastix strix]|uniref:Uncharacterized protein n=1 Tax=Streblomastix strix TaxID=222440 RepID=A0A5J4VJI8_9EUKA|nr:MAG: hypothetical protein EZS28_021925 [Streblomastix strix]
MTGQKTRDTKGCSTDGQLDRLRFYPQFDINHTEMILLSINFRRQLFSVLSCLFCHNKHFTLILHGQ